MTTLIVTDIFGNNKHVEGFASDLANDVSICAPYSACQNFADLPEERVYDQFISLCGHDQYAQKVKDAIMRHQPHTIIAFSAGAVAAWRALAALPVKRVSRLIGFYPSQIRNYLTLRPMCDVELLFPYDEPHFDVGQVISALDAVPAVHCVRTRYQHGFMNPLSLGYRPSAAAHYGYYCQQQVLKSVEASKTKQVEIF
ncbi:hypothetical protein ACFOEE_01535 [Pseudoalteromonas fenneropenaei]|uniref:Dienelactone hydrolase domain-containing protein n=1 Tax=Pseudoalteromonas fenneropenaei TaxID=1737459 RepID=A0ABV7CF32_9GAMM